MVNFKDELDGVYASLMGTDAYLRAAMALMEASEHTSKDEELSAAMRVLIDLRVDVEAIRSRVDELTSTVGKLAS